MVALTTVAVAALIVSLAEQNRELKAALATLQPNDLSSSPSPPEVAPGDTIGTISLVGLDAQDRSDLLGLVEEPAVVAFLTTTCPFCEQNLGAWNRLAEDVAAQGAPFIGISLHPREPTQAYVERHGIDWPVLVVSQSVGPGDLRVRSVPTTLVISPAGKVLGVWKGVLSDADRARIRDALAAGDGQS